MYNDLLIYEEMQKHLKKYRVFDISLKENMSVSPSNLISAVTASEIDPDGRWVIITYAPRQSGKTSALKHLADVYSKCGRHIVFCTNDADLVHTNLGKNVTTTNFIHRKYDNTIDLVLIDQPELFQDEYASQLDHLIKSDNHPTIVIMACPEYTDGLIADYVR